MVFRGYELLGPGWFNVDAIPRPMPCRRAGVSKHAGRVFMRDVNKGSPINCIVRLVRLRMGLIRSWQ